MSGAHAVGMQPDGRILVAGGTAGNFALTRLLNDGQVDIGFGANGRVLTDVNFSAAARDVLVTSDGRILAAALPPRHLR